MTGKKSDRISSKKKKSSKSYVAKKKSAARSSTSKKADTTSTSSSLKTSVKKTTKKTASKKSASKSASKKSIKKSVKAQKKASTKKRISAANTIAVSQSKTVQSTTSPEIRMRELTEVLKHHQYLYYVKNDPEISDREFDSLIDELRKLEEAYPLLAAPDSPAKTVGSDLEGDFPKFEHTIPVLSLANTYSPEEALEWASKNREENSDTLFDVQWKIDGATLVLYYEKGRLVRAVTRGSGQIGDVVTANALTIKSIPRNLSEPVDLVARGESYMTFADFQAFNEAAGSLYANPRNLTAGSMKHKKPGEVSSRPIQWVAFEAHFNHTHFNSEKENLAYMARLGLPVFEDNRFVKYSELEKCIQEFTEKKESVPFPVDGLVIKVDDFSVRKRSGFTAHSPRWATALKFEPEMAETTIEKIEFFVGRTGRVTPRAMLTPVKLAGTTVSYATLHNADYIEKLGAREGAKVKISKRGEIIPAVEEVIDAGPGSPFLFPQSCPSCDNKLVREPDAADFVCSNPECDEKLINAIVFFCQRKQMDITGMGEKVVRTLFKKGFIRYIEDIYELKNKRKELENLEGFGEKSVRLMLDGIEKSREKGFRKLLPSLGLKEIGPNISEILIDEGYDSIDKIIHLARSEMAEEKLTEIDGIGPRTHEEIIRQFHDKKIIDRIEKLRALGLPLEISRTNDDTTLYPQIFVGQIWCVTGSFQQFKPRDIAMEEVRKRGGKTTTSVSKSTTHLLAGEGSGSKLKKAEKLNTHVVTELEFIKMLHEP